MFYCFWRVKGIIELELFRRRNNVNSQSNFTMYNVNKQNTKVFSNLNQCSIEKQKKTYNEQVCHYVHYYSNSTFSLQNHDFRFVLFFKFFFAQLFIPLKVGRNENMQQYTI